LHTGRHKLSGINRANAQEKYNIEIQAQKTEKAIQELLEKNFFTSITSAGTIVYTHEKKPWDNFHYYPRLNK
jgi:ABC-type uncharacterized transport system substrate-binding protein